MHEVFDCEYSDIATALGKNEAAVRQFVHRARARIGSDKRRFDVPAVAHQRLVEQYVLAVQERDADRIAELLSPDAVFVSDGGGKTWAALRPVIGARRIARMETGVLGKLPPKGRLHFRNGFADANQAGRCVAKVAGQGDEADTGGSGLAAAVCRTCTCGYPPTPHCRRAPRPARATQAAYSYRRRARQRHHGQADRRRPPACRRRHDPQRDRQLNDGMEYLNTFGGNPGSCFVERILETSFSY